MKRREALTKKDEDGDDHKKDNEKGEETKIKRVKPTTSAAYSALLRDHQEKNKALLMSALKECDVKHIIFHQIVFLDMIANYAAMVYPLYAKLPPTLERISNVDLCKMLASRRHFRNYCDVGSLRVTRPTTVFWDAEAFIMSSIKEGQIGYFKSKPTETEREVLSPFLVVWKHPEIFQGVHILGVIFPSVEYETKTITITHASPAPFWTYPPTYQTTSRQRTPLFGGDLSSLSSLYQHVMDSINATECTCKMADSVLPEHHPTSCAKKQSYNKWTHHFFSNPQFLEPPKDGYYKVHYFAFWAEEPNQIGSEVCASNHDHRCFIYDILHNYSVHFVTVDEKLPPQHTKDIRKYNPNILPLLPFAFNPDTIHLWPEDDMI
jgi:hypothetical protein